MLRSWWSKKSKKLQFWNIFTSELLSLHHRRLDWSQRNLNRHCKTCGCKSKVYRLCTRNGNTEKSVNPSKIFALQTSRFPNSSLPKTRSLLFSMKVLSDILSCGGSNNFKTIGFIGSSELFLKQAKIGSIKSNNGVRSSSKLKLLDDKKIDFLP